MQGDEAKEGAGSGGADRLGELQARVERLGNLFTQLEGARAAARGKTRQRSAVGVTSAGRIGRVVGSSWDGPDPGLQEDRR